MNTRTIFCQKLNKQAEGLDRPPISGELGQRLYEGISKSAWQQWIAHQTMLINEYRLNVMDPKSKAFLRSELEKFFFGNGSDKPVGYRAA